MKKNENILLTRDYISIGVFSLIYFVVAFVIGGIVQVTPVTFPFMPMVVALFAGSVFMLYILLKYRSEAHFQYWVYLPESYYLLLVCFG